MKELKSIKTRTFQSGNYIIDIIEYKDSFDAYIHHKAYGVKDLMFGSPKQQHTLDGQEYAVDFDYFRDMVEANLPEYKKFFRARHEDI